MKRMPIVLSVTALVVALFGSTPLGHAVSRLVYADNADKVDGFHATATPHANKLVAMNGAANLPPAALPPHTLRGAQVVTKSTGDSAVNHKGATAECPSGKVAIGGGYSVSGPEPLSNGGTIRVVIDAPANLGNDPPFGWFADAREVPVSSDANDTWQMTVWAVCATMQP